MKRHHLLSLAMGLALALTGGSAQAAFRECIMFSGTADGIVKENAVTESREALQEAIGNWRAKNASANAVTSPARPQPKPYWRSEVSPELYFRPDVVDQEAYTVCWRGVVSPVVCTSGAKLCH